MVQHAVATGFVSPGYNGDPWGRIERLLPINVGPKGGFSFPTWEGVETALMIEGRNIWVPWPPPEEPMRIDAATAAPTERTVRLRVRGDESIRAIEGTMALHLIETPPERAHQDVTRTVELRLGQGALQCLSSESFRYDSAAIPGVWTVPGRILGGGPPGDRLADVRAFAAGTIAGRVLEADGSPAGAGARIQAPFDPAWGRGVLRGDDPSGTDDLRVTAEEATTDAEGRFEIPAFPLNVLSRLVVERGRYFAVADAVQVLADDRRREVEFRLPKRAGAAVRVIDPEGRPIPGARLEVLLERSGTERRRWPIGQTDADGLAVVDDLAEGETDYSVIATFASDFQPIVAPLKPGGPTLELRAEPGHVLEGRVEEAVTGWGIPGVTLLAESVDGPTPTQVEVQTDWHGRFRLTTLPPGPIRLEDRLGLHWVSPRSPIVRAGTSEPVLIRVIDLPDSATRRNRLPEF
jgi:hypothetical protein